MTRSEILAILMRQNITSESKMHAQYEDAPRLLEDLRELGVAHRISQGWCVTSLRLQMKRRADQVSALQQARRLL